VPSGDCIPGSEYYLYINRDPTTGYRWYDQSDNTQVCDPWSYNFGNCEAPSGINYNFVGVVGTSICDQVVTNVSGGSDSSGTYSGTYQETLTDEVTTFSLETLVDSLATSRAPSTFSKGPAIVLNSMSDEEETCVGAVRTPNWRISVTGTTPGKSYDISWFEIIAHADGTWQILPVKITARSPNQDPWYVTGGAIPIPAWPTGCPANGGTELIIYMGPDLKYPANLIIAPSPNQ
jgi:predicted secreted protein